MAPILTLLIPVLYFPPYLFEIEFSFIQTTVDLASGLCPSGCPNECVCSLIISA
jgi:hypothetical protein